jgi:prepilin-type N-terminal cleavage/methylation domain-containing protein/prepilin-type processing-associated H-X9-DG protein
MNTRVQTRCSNAAFTLLETLVVIAIIGILAVMLLPAVEKARARSRQAACMSNLRQIGLGLQSFRHDHEGIYPTGVPVLLGGVKEFFFTPLGALRADWWEQSHRVFQSLSNYIETPRIVVCPADKWRRRAESFHELKRENVSYFTVVAEPGLLDGPDDIWAGDAWFSLTNGMSIYTAERAWAIQRWSGHGGTRGNLLYADGRVESQGTEGPLQGGAQAFARQDPAFGAPPTPPPNGDTPASGNDGGNGSSQTASSGGSSTGPGGGGGSGGGAGAGSGGGGGGNAFAILNQAFGSANGNRSSGSFPSRPELAMSPQLGHGQPRPGTPLSATSSTNFRSFAELIVASSNGPPPVATPNSAPPIEGTPVLAQAEAPVPAKRNWWWLAIIAVVLLVAFVLDQHRRARKNPRRPRRHA